MWLWIGTCWRARPIETHDTGSGDAILSCTGNPDGCATLFSRCRCVVGGMYFWRAFRTSNSLSSTKSRSTGKSSRLQVDLWRGNLKSNFSSVIPRSWNWSLSFWVRHRWKTWGMRAMELELTCSEECQSSHHYQLFTR